MWNLPVLIQRQQGNVMLLILIKLFAITILILFFAGCGSTEVTKIDLPGFHYYEINDIHDRVYSSDMVGFVIEVTYNQDNNLPYVRAGFASSGRFVDTTGKDFAHAVTIKRHFEVPWLFVSDIETTSTPTNLYSPTQIPEILAIEQELLFDPEAEAIE